MTTSAFQTFTNARRALPAVASLVVALAAAGCGELRPEDMEADLQAAAKADSRGLDLRQLSPDVITGRRIESYVAWAILKRGLPGNCELIDFRSYNHRAYRGGLELDQMRIILKSYDVDAKEKFYLMDSPYSDFEDITSEADRGRDIRHYRYHEGDRFQYLQVDVKVDINAGEVIAFRGETAFGFKYNKSSCVKPVN